MIDRLAWTPVQTEVLLTMFIDERKNATQIAREMTALYGVPLTRNAIMGKLDRLGIKRETEDAPPPPREPRPRGRPRRSQPVVTAAAPVQAPSITPDEPRAAITLLDFNNETCRFPVGTEPDGLRSILFCGAPEADLIKGTPYCPYHCRIAYSPPRGHLHLPPRV